MLVENVPAIKYPDKNVITTTNKLIKMQSVKIQDGGGRSSSKNNKLWLICEISDDIMSCSNIGRTEGPNKRIMPINEYASRHEFTYTRA